MKVTISAISDTKSLSDIRFELDAFTTKNSNEPFYLHTFLERQIQTTLSKGSIPIILILRVEKNIAGVVPLVINQKAGVRSIKFLYDYYFSPDFVFLDRYRAACMESTLNYIFKNLKCKLLNFDIPANSPNLVYLQQTCKSESVPLQIRNDTNIHHAIINIRSNWEEFIETKGKKFNKKMRQIERRLNDTGECEVEVFENANDEQKAFNKIIEVEKGCWKNNCHIHNNTVVLSDQDLLNLWTSSGLATKNFSNFKRRVWFLNLDGKPIAYNLAVEYKGTIYMCKTSFNNKFRNLSPGIYLNNVAIKDSFNSDCLNMIDFLTDLPFHERWTRSRLLRIRFSLSKGTIVNMYGLFVKQMQSMNANLPINDNFKALCNLWRM